MRVLIVLTAYLLHAADAAPQFVTFKDGKIGVNFGGYHAEAGLGGLLTGNAAHGGLSASAGTPWGQNAAAGLGGSVDGRTSGLAYAGAQAIPSVGASAALGGTAGADGFIGSEAHANGKTHTKTISSSALPMNYNYEPHTFDPVTSGPATTLESRSDFIQKIKPPKKYSLIKSEESHTPSLSPSSNTPAENADHTLITSGSGDTAGVQNIPTASNTDSYSYSNGSPATMIHIHRQRMRERRRLQLQQQETQNELQKRRANEHRMRARQRLHQRRNIVAHNKDITIYPSNQSTDITTQYPISNDVNTVHSKHLVKSYHKSVAQADAPGPAAPNNNVNVHYSSNPGMLGNILNIPIGILRTIQESLTGVQVEKSLSVSG